MTTQDPDYAVTTPTAGLPTPDEVLAQTSWHDLEHARGSAGDLPAGLRRLLDDNILARTDAVATCLEVASHQSSTYTATTPVALYVAAILADPRASELEIISRDGKLPLLRVVLIDWLAAIAHDVSDEVLAIGRRNGFDEYPEQTTLRAARPVLFQAVMAFTRDTQPIVRQAAVAAALQILDTPEERHLHQQQLELNESPRSDSYRFPRSWAYEDPGSLPLRLVFRTVIAERFQTIPKTPQAAMLFTEPLRPTDAGDYTRFVLDLASGDGPKILSSIETLINAYREGTPRQAPLRSRALHLLDQMLTNVRRRLKATVAADA